MTKELSMQELLDQQEQLLSSINVGETITGTITKINNDEVTVGLNIGFDGVIPVSELNLQRNQEVADVYKVGDEISAVITKVSEKDCTLKLSKLKLDMISDKAELANAHENHKIVTVNVVKTIPRGLFAAYKSVEIFIPISQLNTKFVNDTKEYQDANLEVYIIEFNEKANKIVGSHREVLQERLDQERKARKERIQAEREAEKAEIEAEKEAEVEVKEDDVVIVPEIEDDVVIEDLVDDNNEAIDDTEDAVVDYEPAVDSEICDCDSNDHNHVVTTEGGFTYIFCDHVEEIKVIDGVKYMPWIYFGFDNEAAYVAATTPVEEVEVVEVVEVEAEEVEEETTEAIETEEVVVAEEIVEETVEEVVEAEEVEEETTVSGNEI